MLAHFALAACLALPVAAAPAGDQSSPVIAPRPVAIERGSAPAETRCTGVDRAMAMIEAVGGRNFQFLDGDAARGGATVFNATPPVSQDAWTLVALVDGPDGTGSILVGRDAQVCGRVNFTADLWPRLVERLLGRPT